MERSARVLRLYAQPSATPPLNWSWVDQQLTEAGTYWAVPPGGPFPHPRPVWGVWESEHLHLSIGSPVILARLTPGVGVTVHLDSGTDVVVVEGRVSGNTGDQRTIAAYDRKYDWTYDVDTYGPLTTVTPVDVLAWRSAGWAGREGFQQTGRWTYTDHDR